MMPPSISDEMASDPVSIGIAVVEHEGRYLVGFRGEESSLAGYAEFPGGKCLPGESPRDCAVRECREETGLEIEPVRLLLVQPWDYPHGRVELHFWLCRPLRAGLCGEGDVGGVQGFQWVSQTQLPSLPFPDANRSVISLLADHGRNDLT